MLDYTRFNNYQKEAILSPIGPAIIYAGAGTGKTTVLTSRILHLIEQEQVNPSNILAITFTNKAAKVMSDRVASSLGVYENSIFNSDRIPLICTFHKFCSFFLRDNIKYLKTEGASIYTKNFTICDDVDSQAHLKKVITRNNLIDPSEINKNGSIPSKILRLISSTVSRVKSQCSSSEDFPVVLDKFVSSIYTMERSFNQSVKNRFDTYISWIDNFDKIFNLYNIELAKYNKLDFDDMLIKTNDILISNEKIRTRTQNQYRHILVDEFQDTNITQIKLIDLIATESIFVVGDDDQNIYSWRGASELNMVNFKRKFEGAKKYFLLDNYRSYSEILNVSNKIIVNNKNREEKELKSVLGVGGKVFVKKHRDALEEAKNIVNIIKYDLLSTGVKHSEIAILFRSAYLMANFEKELRANRIAYKIYGGFSFYKRFEIKLLNKFLHIALAPSDDMNLLDIISMTPGVGEKSCEKIFMDAHNSSLSVFDYLNSKKAQSTAIYKKIKDKIENINNFIDAMEDDFIKAMASCVEILKLEELLSNEFPGEDVTDRIENINNECSNFNLKFGKDEDNTNYQDSIHTYLQEVSLINTQDESIDTDKKILISTIHAVKGMEFENVFLVGLEEEVLPSKKSIETGSIEEERRLVYVAMTRAKKQLHLSYTSSRYGYVGSEVSRFLIESGELEKMQSYRYEQARIDPTQRPDYAKMNREHKQRVAKAIVNVVRNDASVYKVGQKIKHKKFGIGTIQSILGSNAKIEFENGVKKDISLVFSKLEIISE